MIFQNGRVVSLEERLVAKKIFINSKISYSEVFCFNILIEIHANRIKQLNIFVKSITKKSQIEYSSLQVKELIPLENLNSSIFEK